MNRDELENIDNLFNIARMIGNYNKPLSDKEMLMDKYGVHILGLIITFVFSTNKFYSAMTSDMKENVFSNVKTPLDMIRKGTRMQKFGR